MNIYSDYLKEIEERKLEVQAYQKPIVMGNNFVSFINVKFKILE